MSARSPHPTSSFTDRDRMAAMNRADHGITTPITPAIIRALRAT
jgi:hypothetical protein